VREASTKVGNPDVRAVKGGRTHNDRGLFQLATRHTTRCGRS
jgi:hypothetical protein